ncbi:MAG: hypothetical protein K6A34_03090 [Methanobrevibacter sp.]|nr:hypothetical protein [Methanobrevibacter sp.]
MKTLKVMEDTYLQKNVQILLLKLATGKDIEFQDLILSVHHACIDFFNKNEGGIKILANSQKKFFMQ